MSGCVPGQGCGTVSATFAAASVGTAIISATREICGEALVCGGTDRMYEVTIAVS